MRARGWPVAAVAALALALAAPAPAAAADTYVIPAGSTTGASVRASNGFGVRIWENDLAAFRLIVKGHHSRTIYSVGGGPVSGGRVSADLGKRGEFDLRFVPAGRPSRVRVASWCDDAMGRWERGFLVGRFRFRGERDFTQVRGHRLPAARESWPSLRCHYASGSEYHPAKEPRFRVLAWSRGRRGADFAAALFHRQARPAARRVQFRATAYGRAGRVSIDREIAVAGPEADLDIPGPPRLSEEVTVSPPAPFTGTATFARTHESTFTWTGDLAVDFPGRGVVRLAGPRFGARLCTLEGCISREPEDEADEGGGRP